MRPDKMTGNHPQCFGDLDTVFPKGKHGLRVTPNGCLKCIRKTECLRAAMAGIDGLKVRGESIDRAYAAGRMTFLERWSRKKAIEKRIRKQAQTVKGPST